MFEYLNCKKSIIVFERQRYIIKRSLKNSIEWKCTQCKLVNISTMDNKVIKRPNKHHLLTCKEMSDVEITCEIEYDLLKMSEKDLSSQLKKKKFGVFTPY